MGVVREIDQLSAFSDDLDRLCDHYADEFDISAAAVCGVMLMKIRLIQDEAIRVSKEKGDEAA